MRLWTLLETGSTLKENGLEVIEEVVPRPFRARDRQPSKRKDGKKAAIEKVIAELEAGLEK